MARTGKIGITDGGDGDGRKLSSLGALRSRVALDSTQLRLLDVLMIVAFGGLLGALLVPGWSLATRTLEERDIGRPARFDVTAPADFAYSAAEVELKQARDEAARRVPAVFDYETEAGSEAIGRVHAGFAAAREAGGDADRFVAALGQPVDPPAAQALAKDGFSDEVRAALVFLVGTSQEGMIIGDRKSLPVEPHVMAIRYLTSASGEAPREEIISDYRGVVGLNEARAMLARKVEVNYGRLPKDLRAALIAVGTALLQANLRENPSLTDARREEARRTIVSRPTPYVRGQIIVREGDLVRPEHLSIQAAMRRGPHVVDRAMVGVGIGLLIALLLGVLIRYAKEQMRRLEFGPRDILALGALLLLFVAGARLAAVVQERFDFQNDSRLPLLLPIAAGPMLVRMILGARATLLFAVVLSLLAALALHGDTSLVAYYLVTSVAGAIAMRRVQSRRAILRAGLLVGGVGATAALSLCLYEGQVESALYAASLGALSGLFSVLATTSLLPILESIFGYTTDITLLELANLSHPLLHSLSLRAPGTYHHSMVVGSLAESACEAIGANGLLARVAAYFHDVGKMKNAPYFAENFRQDDSPHARLKASMSALIIRTHVKDSVDMLLEHKIPKIVIDTATQHHGTTLIEYFHHKAGQERDPDEDVREEDYRYLGRKPQTREAGVLMLADGAEAASRSLVEPSDDRLATVVHRIINKKFADGQLDECDLTLRDLNEIARAFLRVLRGIYHGRPAYPWQKPERTDKTEPPNKERERRDVGESHNPRARHTTPEVDVTVEHAAEGRGTFKRLGLD